MPELPRRRRRRFPPQPGALLPCRRFGVFVREPLCYRLFVRVPAIPPCEPCADLLEPDIPSVDDDGADLPSIAVLLGAIRIRSSAEGQPRQILFGALSILLEAFRGVHSADPDPVLQIGTIDQGERVAVRDSHHAADDVRARGCNRHAGQ